MRFGAEWRNGQHELDSGLDGLMASGKERFATRVA